MTAEEQIQVDEPTIFLIDDEEIVTEMTRMYLEDMGYTKIHVFNNSVEAMEALAIVKADLIITDVNMPELGGKFLTKLVSQSEHLKDAFVIVVTSDDSKETQNRLFCNGVDSILVKPIDQQTLHSEVTRLMDQRKSEIIFKSKMRNASKMQSEEHSLRKAFNRT